MKYILSPAAAVALVALVGTARGLADQPPVGHWITLSSDPLVDDTDSDAAGAVEDSSTVAGDSYDLFAYDPRWTVTAGAVFLHRSPPPSRTVVVNAADGSELVNAKDFALGWGVGPRVDLIRHLDSGYDFQVLYFGIDNWTGTAEATGGAITFERFWEEAVFDDMSGRYGSDLYSLEFNLRWPLGGRPWLMGIAGFRWVGLKEEASARATITLDPLVLTGAGSIELENYLYGLQLGTEAAIWDPEGPFRVDGFLKAGVYGNSTYWSLFTTLDGTIHNDWDKKGCHVAFVGDMAVIATYKPCCCGMSLFAGYQLLWLEGVAMSTLQEKREIIYGDTFAHGPMVGFDWHW